MKHTSLLLVFLLLVCSFLGRAQDSIKTAEDYLAELEVYERKDQQKESYRIYLEAYEAGVIDTASSNFLKFEFFLSDALLSQRKFELVKSKLRPYKNLAVQESEDITKGWAYCMYNLGAAHASLNETDSAIYFFKTSINAFEKLSEPDNNQLAKANSYIGYLYNYILHESNFGEDYYLISQGYLRKFDADNIRWAKHYANLAGCYSYTDYQKAVNYNTKAINLIKDIPEMQGEVIRLRLNVANSYSRQGLNRKAIVEYKKSIVELQELYPKVHKQQIIPRRSLGILYNQIGEFDNSLILLKEALDIAKVVYGDNSLICAKIKFSYSTSFFKKYGKESILKGEAFSVFKEKFSLESKYVSNFYAHYGSMYFKRKMLDSAIYYYFIAGHASEDMGDYLVLPKEKTEYAKEDGKAVLGKAQVIFEIGKQKGSIKHVKSSIDHYKLLSRIQKKGLAYKHSELERLSFAKGLSLINKSAINACYYYYQQTGEGLEDLWYFIEKSKSDLLLLQSEEGDRDSKVVELEEVSAYRRELKGTSLKLQSQQDVEGVNQDSIRLELYNMSLEIDSLDALLKKKEDEIEHEVTPLDQLQADFLREPETGLIQYSATNEGLYIFSINANETKVELVEAEALEQLKKEVSIYKKMLYNGIDRENQLEQHLQFVSLARSLHKSLIPATLKDCKRLIVLPDDFLSGMSFDALLTEDILQPDEVNYRNLPYLIQQSQINYAYSASWLAARKDDVLDTKASNTSLLAVAYSGESDGERAGLPGTEKEVQAIEALWPGDITSFVKEEALESNFKSHQQEYDILHLATHNDVDTLKTLGGGLVFRPEEGEDGILEPTEIYQLLSGAKLVSLSACESSLGKYESGEGYYSTGHAFAQLGIPFIVSSLWYTSDVYSQHLMTNFYNNIALGEGPGMALHHSKLQVLQAGDELSAFPSNWASFVMMGNFSEPKSLYSSTGKYLGIAVGLGVLALLGAILIRRSKRKTA